MPDEAAKPDETPAMSDDERAKLPLTEAEKASFDAANADQRQRGLQPYSVADFRARHPAKALAAHRDRHEAKRDGRDIALHSVESMQGKAAADFANAMAEKPGRRGGGQAAGG